MSQVIVSVLNGLQVPKNEISKRGCSIIYFFVGKNDCFELQKYAEKFAAGCFHEVVECEEFLQLNFDEVCLLSFPKYINVGHKVDGEISG